MKPPALALAALSFASAAGAQTRPCGSARANVALADLGLHVIGVGYQRRLTCHVAVQVAAEFYSPWTVNTDLFGVHGSDWPADADVSGFGGRARAFYYPFGAAPTGLWVSPFVQAMAARATRRGQAVSGTALAGGVSVGYAWLFADRLHLALGAGAQYHQASVGGSQSAPGYGGLWPQVDINVGYAF